MVIRHCFQKYKLKKCMYTHYTNKCVTITYVHIFVHLHLIFSTVTGSQVL